MIDAIVDEEVKARITPLLRNKLEAMLYDPTNEMIAQIFEACKEGVLDTFASRLVSFIANDVLNSLPSNFR